MPSKDNTNLSLKGVQDAIEAEAFEEANTLLAPILEEAPDYFDALYMAAVCARYLGRPEHAQKYIDHMKMLYPEFGRVYQEEGHLYVKTDPERALRSYRQACRQNPSLLASWRGQGNLLAAKGMVKAAEAALANGKSVAAQPQAIQAAMNHMHEGRLTRAEELCRGFLVNNKHHVEGMRLLAQLAFRHGENDQAEFILETLLEFAPQLLDIRLEYIEILKNRQKISEATEQSALLVAQEPENVHCLSVHATNLMQLGRYDEALEFFDQTLARVPDDPITLTSKAHALKTMGRDKEAIEAYRRAVQNRPDHGDGYYSLANLKTYEFQKSEMETMEAQMARPDLFPADRIHISFALAKAYEDNGDYEAAFANLRAGNESKKRQVGYTADAMHAEMQRQMDICGHELFAKQSGKGCPAPDPIFIVGLPRAGSTLIEQILASHSQVDGTLELPNILSLSHRLRGRQQDNVNVAYPQVLHDLTDAQLAQFGQEFIDETRMHRKDAPFFTDKMPNNFRHIGLIHLILPNAKIIDARRNPMDCCFSGFKQLFAQGQEFTYGLTEIGRYYADYVRLMAHWDTVLPGKVLRVQHEDVLEDVDGQVRRILDYLGLPFEENCVRFHETKRAVRTASSEQVRRPINRDGVGRWRPFISHLKPLAAALGPDLMALEDYNLIMEEKR
mgnify:CR=1 FL=1